MKTNVNMVRKMQNYDVLQRTRDGMFNATKLLKQWNKNPNTPQRDLKDFWKLSSVSEFLEVLEEEEGLHGVNLPYVKSKASRGENAGTWMHPILFIKFSMWLNPRYEYHVIKFIYDQLIKFRHDAGDNYRSLASSIQRFSPTWKEFAQIAKALNYVVFDRHEKNLRQKATEAQLERLSNLEHKLAFAVDMGYINSFDQLMSELRKIYLLKLS